jgi:uroporphyrinogen III methyltransferase/synthase
MLPSDHPSGRVYLIGAGPGDPGLITVKGRQRLSEADVVIYDYLAPAELLGVVKTGADVIYVGKKGGGPRVNQEQINQLLIEKARQGLIVARLKGGDPFIFGRGGEEALVLAKAGVPFEVVPGVTSAIAVPTYAGIPLTHRDWASTVTFVTGVTGHEDADEFAQIDWTRLAGSGNTLVILMGLGRLRQIAAALLAAGRAPVTPAAVTQWGTTAQQRTITAPLSAIADRVEEAGLRPPAVIVIGEVVGLREQLNWHEAKPLFGKKILITRAKEQAQEFIEQLAQYGAEPVEFPTIEILPPEDWAPLDRAIAHLADYDWLLFTSVNGVEFFMKRLREKGGDLRKLKSTKIGAIGPKTAEAIHSHGLVPDLVPKYFQAEAILEGLTDVEMKGKRILLPRAFEAREILPQELAKRGAQVDVVPSYRTVIPTARRDQLRKMLERRELAVITFTSSSTVKNFMALFEGEPVTSWLEGVKIACIGPITADTARELGLRVDIQPKDFTVAALAKEIAEGFGNSSR